MESIQLYLNSNIADKYFDNQISNCEYILPIIEIPDGFHIYLSVVNCQIPYSFYNINSSNNKLIYQLFEIVNNVESYFNSVTVTNTIHIAPKALYGGLYTFSRSH